MCGSRIQNDAVKKFMGQSKRINREDINCNFTKDKKWNLMQEGIL